MKNNLVVGEKVNVKINAGKTRETVESTLLKVNPKTVLVKLSETGDVVNRKIGRDL